jgi:hypothetical protein
MFQELIHWDIYEIRTEKTPINGVMLRWRIRKFCLNEKRNVLVENTGDIQWCVRFAIPADEDPEIIIHYLQSIIWDAEIERVLWAIPNPVLSKLIINQEDRYTL